VSSKIGGSVDPHSLQIFSNTSLKDGFFICHHRWYEGSHITLSLFSTVVMFIPFIPISFNEAV
jgi:hypothetical protein